MKRISWALVVTVVVVFGCGGDDEAPPGNACTAENCSGCCDSNDNCVVGESSAYCGRGGIECSTCTAEQVCFEGVCVVGGGCSPTTCDGCCLGDTCMAGHELSACGKEGQPCDVCKGPEVCVVGVCGRVCGPGTCADGCCFNGECIEEEQQSINICGTGGEACRVCGDGEQCIQRKCEAVTCGLGTCGGCCDANGNCRVGDSETACGKGGQACEVCTRDEACNDQVCQTVVTTCGAVCAGCCDAQGTCRPGNARDACGEAGGSCEACGSGQECVAGGCACTETACAGCCDGAACRGGTELSACGTGGAQCAACTGDDKCLQGTCKPDCSYLTCSGCCDANDNCVDASAAQCGIFASACRACAAGEQCESGSCNDASECNGDATSCPLGCCQDSVCQAGDMATACGDGGGSCEICGPHLECGVDATSGQRACLAAPTSRWEVIVGHLTLREGEDWDDGLEGDDKPDPFVELIVPSLGSTEQYKSDNKDNTYDYVFNDYLLTTTASILDGDDLEFVVWEDDIFSDHDLIARCRFEVTPLMLKSGSVTFYGCPGDAANQSLISLSFTLRIVGI